MGERAAVARLSREESQAATRERLIASATELFGRDGYAATSIERVAEAAGFSKGAFYSNFDSKEAILLVVLDRLGRASLDRVIADIEDAATPGQVVDALAGWADARSRSGNWSLAILEHARLAGRGAASFAAQRRVLASHWQLLGGHVRKRFPDVDADAATIGALLHEIAYAPAITFMPAPTAGTLVRLALSSWSGPTT